MNHTVCEIVFSNSGQAKINVNGYIMVKNRNRNDLYYWSCEKHNTLYCKARATTIFVEGQHRHRQASDHNHDVEPSVNSLERRARETDETPAQIIQTVVTKNHKSPSCQVELEKEAEEDTLVTEVEMSSEEYFRRRRDEKVFNNQLLSSLIIHNNFLRLIVGTASKSIQGTS